MKLSRRMESGRYDRSRESRKLANRTLMTLLESLNSHSGSRVVVSKVKGLERLHRIALLETRDYRLPSLKEREPSKRIRPLRSLGMLSDGLSYKCSVENLLG